MLNQSIVAFRKALWGLQLNKTETCTLSGLHAMGQGLILTWFVECRVFEGKPKGASAHLGGAGARDPRQSTSHIDLAAWQLQPTQDPCHLQAIHVANRPS